VVALEAELSKEEMDRLWKWIDRPLSPVFFKYCGKMSDDEFQRRIDEIPIPYRRLAWAIYLIALEHKKMGRNGKHPGSCQQFRILLFSFVKKSRDEYPLPYYWFTDGVMIEPEWIVRLTNGLVQWVCDSSKENCGLHGRCRFSS
jgi:hypothetical protein